MGNSFLPPDWRDRLNQHRHAPRPRWLQVASWIWIGFTAFTVISIVALLLLINQPWFHGYLIRQAETKASERLGVRVRLQNFALHPESLSLDLYGMTIAGADPYPNPPLLEVDHVEAGVRIVSILHRAWYFDNVRVDHPVAHVFVDERGISNIPTLKSSASSSSPTIFELGIRHALLDRGEVYYNNKPRAVNADLHDMEFRATFNSLLQQYSGRLSYSDGRLLYGTFRPVTHNLDVQFEATPTTFTLTQAKLTIGASQVVISASLRNYNNPDVQGHYDVTMDGGQMANVFRNASIPAGIIRATGTVQYQQAANRSALDSLMVNGDINSRRLTMKTPSLHANVDGLVAHYSVANGNASLHDLRANLLGGALTAQGVMKNIAGESDTSLKGTIRGVSLAQARQLLGPSVSKSGIGVDGAMNADVSASWGQTFNDLVAHVDASIHGQARNSQLSSKLSAVQNTVKVSDKIAAPFVIPVESQLHATYKAKNSQLVLDKSYLRTPHTTLTMNGAVSIHSNLAIHLEAGDLHELETIVDLFIPPSRNHPLQQLGLSGSASFQGTVQGSTASPHLTGQLTASNLQFNGTAWKTLRTRVDISPSLASLQNAELEPASRGRISFNASAGLSKWSFANTSPVHIQLQASQVDLADLTKFAGQDIPITGTLNAEVSLHGTELNPIGRGSLSLTNVTAYQQPVRSVKATFSGDGKEADGELSIQLPSGSLQGKASILPGDKTYTASLTAKGIQLEKLQALKTRDINLSGTLAMDAKGHGSFDNPQLDATVTIPTLAVQSQTVTGLSLRMSVADHIANAALISSAVNTAIQAKAKIALTGDYLTDASLDTQSIPLEPLLAAYAPEQAANVAGQTEVHATLHGPLKNPNLLEAHVTIPTFQVTYGKSIQLAAASPIHVDFKNNVVDIQRASIRGTDTDLQFQGSIPASGTGAMSLLLLGTVNLQLAQLFDPDVRSSGQIRLNINSHGPADGSNLDGQIEIVDANIASADLPVGLEHANGTLKLTKDRLNINSLSGVVGGGTLTAQGGVAYRPRIQFDLGLTAKSARILYPQGMRENVDANLRLAGSSRNARLSGSVDLADLSFTPAFDLASFTNQFSGGVAAPPTQGFAQNLQLNIALHSTSNVNLVSRTLSVGGSANLQVRGTAAEPVILGRVNLNNGDIILNGNRFVLNGGTIQFINPSETQPVVNLTLNTNIQQYSINLRFNGPIDQLHTQYSSNPALPSADIINLLAFGQTTEASAAAATPTNQAAESLVASQVSSQVTSRISKVAGISQLSISPVLAGSNSQGQAGATITIQQRVTGNLFVNFSTNVGSTQSQTVQGEYRISPRVAFSATRDPNGGFGFDTLIKKSW
ncbi:MAG TPA: translocation/assembly module TamB domain-containing protein [Terracidiphilus sp.]|jgi:translocation and assembly module TamB